MTLPAGVTRGQGERLAVSQKGYFCKFSDGSIHHTACRFASLAQSLARRGLKGSLSRKRPASGQPDNFVHQLQVAGDNTPKTGSTIKQAQKALRVLFPDKADDPGIKFGTMTETEFFAALQQGATVGIGFDCSKLPPAQKRWVGQKYMGGHFLTFDDVRGLGTAEIEVAVTDPMYTPAKAIKSTWQPWSDFSPAASRLNGELRVTVGYQPVGTTPPPAWPGPTTASIAAAEIANPPDEIVLDKVGAYWRHYVDSHYSMPPVSAGNYDIEPAVVFVPKAQVDQLTAALQAVQAEYTSLIQENRTLSERLAAKDQKAKELVSL